MLTIGERIKAYRNQLGINQKQLAELCAENDHREKSAKWGQSRIGNYETNARMPDLEDIKILSKVLGIEPQTLAFDSNVKFVQVNKSFSYPLLSAVKAGYFTEINLLNNIDSDEQFEMISSQVKASAKAFYLKIEGQSMEPRFHEGDMVLIDPEIYPNPGDFVAALNENNEATFKKYKQLAQFAPSGEPHFELIPLNDVFPTLSSLEQNIKIIGKAVEHRQCL